MKATKHSIHGFGRVPPSNYHSCTHPDVPCDLERRRLRIQKIREKKNSD